MDQPPPELSEEQRRSWIGHLFAKLAMTKKSEMQSGANTGAAQEEVWRQIREVAKENHISKSGEE